MADLLISDIDPGVRQLLERRAEAAGRSLQLEVRSILEGAARATNPGASAGGEVDETSGASSRAAREDAARAEIERIRASFGDRVLSDSAEIIRQLRDA